MAYEIKNVPAWAEERNLKREGQEVRAEQNGVFWHYAKGDDYMTLSGAVLAQELRDLADMIDANRPFSMKGWARWADMDLRQYGGRFFIRGPDGTAMYDSIVEIPGSAPEGGDYINAVKDTMCDAPSWLTDLPVFDSHRYQK